MTKEVFEAYRNDGWHIFRLIKDKAGNGNAVKGMYKTPLGWNDTSKTTEYKKEWVYGGVPPSDIVAIDYDVKKGKVGDKSFQQLQKDLGVDLDTCVLTPSGGGHCYLRLYGLPEETPKLKKAQDKYPDIDFQSHESEFVVLGGQTIEGYGEYKFIDEDFEYFVNDTSTINFVEHFDLRIKRVQGEGYSEIDVFEHLSVRPPKEEIEELLSRLNADCPYDTWAQIAMSLNSWDLNGKEGEDLFVNWSLTSESEVEKFGEEGVRAKAIAKYAGCVADTPNFFNKLFTTANTASEKGFDEMIDKAETIENLEDVAKAIQQTRIKNTKREVYIEKLCDKCKELTGKPEKVKWKNAVRYVDAAKAKERQDAAEELGMPDYQHTDKGVKYLPTYANLMYFVDNISEHKFKYDVILKRVIVNNNYEVRTGENTIAYSKLSDELSRYGISNTILSSHFDAMAFSKCTNPLILHIEQLPIWDGAVDYISEVAKTLKTDKATEQYKRAVLEAFVVQAIAAWDGKERTPHKLSRLESVMTFVGKQGGGKTTWVSNLMPDFMKYYFKDGVELNPSDKDSLIQAINAGLVELGELDATNRKSDISSLKAFLSNTEDEFRAPYGRSSERYKRQTVFVGTVNNTDFLKDATGSRRFLVLDVKELTLPSKEIVEGMWSQALQLYLSGKDWRLSNEHVNVRDNINKGFTDIGMAGDIAEDFAKIVSTSEGIKQRYSITKIISELGLKMNSRERSDFIAALDSLEISRYADGKYYLPKTCFQEYKLKSIKDEFEDLDDEL